MLAITATLAVLGVQQVKKKKRAGTRSRASPTASADGMLVAYAAQLARAASAAKGALHGSCDTATTCAPASDVDSSGSASTSAPAAGAQQRASLFAASLDKLPAVHDCEGNIVTQGFVELCELTTPLIDSFGAAFRMVRDDIQRNCARLRTRMESDPQRFLLLYPIVLDEVARDDHAHSQSCTKAVLWLKRGMEFMLSIMARVLAEPGAPLAEVAAERYAATLHRWHGFIASGAFNVAISFVPSRQTFVERLAGGPFTAEAAAEMTAYVERFGALLAEVHSFLDENGLDDPTKV